MFIFTAKLPRRKLALGTAAAAFLCCAALALLLRPPAAVSAAVCPIPKGYAAIRTASSIWRNTAGRCLISPPQFRSCKSRTHWEKAIRIISPCSLPRGST